MDMNTVVFIGIVVLVVWMLYSRFRPTKYLRSLNTTDFQSEIGKGKDRVLLDVREPGEYQTGCIPGAVNVPLSRLQQRLDEIPKDKEVLLYCRSGMRSKSAAKILHQKGYSRLAELQGGISAWKGKLAKK
ncbi:rhodanese-like domain-containing protein [Paenibacillus sp. ClWae2A]|uniref:rhodanese-like domain-containing protein n=1 Tax=Paenibacillus sp. ClWae2A TaxID=3057177 RepID=UPI0028F5B706|nr:rhodanese-like domain-containing protein [Paenibacillus sp. ClWae2A]MDT9717427.1 rhodanese-like domain-containing protein [Paenibacillus sp. ClWae2A]